MPKDQPQFVRISFHFSWSVPNVERTIPSSQDFKRLIQNILRSQGSVCTHLRGFAPIHTSLTR